MKKMVWSSNFLPKDSLPVCGSKRTWMKEVYFHHAKERSGFSRLKIQWPQDLWMQSENIPPSCYRKNSNNRTDPKKSIAVKRGRNIQKVRGKMGNKGRHHWYHNSVKLLCRCKALLILNLETQSSVWWYLTYIQINALCCMLLLMHNLEFSGHNV